MDQNPDGIRCKDPSLKHHFTDPHQDQDSDKEKNKGRPVWANELQGKKFHS